MTHYLDLFDMHILDKCFLYDIKTSSSCYATYFYLQLHNKQQSDMLTVGPHLKCIKTTVSFHRHEAGEQTESGWRFSYLTLPVSHACCSGG